MVLNLPGWLANGSYCAPLIRALADEVGLPAARAASGHAVAPPTRPINSRRLMTGLHSDESLSGRAGRLAWGNRVRRRPASENLLRAAHDRLWPEADVVAESTDVRFRQ